MLDRSQCRPHESGHGHLARLEAFFRVERVLPSPFDAAPQYRVTVGDHLWQWIYLPIMRGVEALARFAGRIQQGRISIYLVYSFVTLLALLMFIR